MKIHYFSGEAWEEAYVKARLPGEEIVFHTGPLAAFPDLADPDAQMLCTFIESKIGEAELKRFPAVKLIATRSTGFDHIDLTAAQAPGARAPKVPFSGAKPSP